MSIFPLVKPQIKLGPNNWKDKSFVDAIKLVAQAAAVIYESMPYFPLPLLWPVFHCPNQKKRQVGHPLMTFSRATSLSFFLAIRWGGERRNAIWSRTTLQFQLVCRSTDSSQPHSGHQAKTDFCWPSVSGGRHMMSSTRNSDAIHTIAAQLTSP